MTAVRKAPERGSAAVELVLVTPVLVVLLLFVVLLGRLTSARADVDAAARDAARAAAIARSGTDARTRAGAAAEATLTANGVTCRRLTVAVDTADFTPGGTVAANVSCVVDLSDLAGLRVPASRTVAARFVAPVDLYRGLS